MARTISRRANQSAVILVMTRLNKMAPSADSRPVNATSNRATTHDQPPSAIAARPPAHSFLSPTRWTISHWQRQEHTGD